MGQDLACRRGTRRDWAEDVRGRAFDCGHYLLEEALAALVDFFAK
jgi:hypothetical protein